MFIFYCLWEHQQLSQWENRLSSVSFNLKENKKKKRERERINICYTFRFQSFFTLSKCQGTLSMSDLFKTPKIKKIFKTFILLDGKYWVMIKWKRQHQQSQNVLMSLDSTRRIFKHEWTTCFSGVHSPWEKGKGWHQ